MQSAKATIELSRDLGERINTLRKAVKRQAVNGGQVQKECSVLLHGEYGEGDEAVLGLSDLQWMVHTLTKREEFEGEGNHSTDMLLECRSSVERLKHVLTCAHTISYDLSFNKEHLPEIYSQLDELLGVAGRMAADATRHFKAAEEALRQQPQPLRLTDITRYYTYNILQNTDEEEKKEAYRIALMLQEGGLTEKDIARFFKKGYWEPYESAPPVQSKVHHSYTLRAKNDYALKGVNVRGKGVEESIAAYLCQETGAKTDTSVAIQIRKPSVDIKAEELAHGMVIWPEKHTRYVITNVEVEKEIVTVTARKTFRSKGLEYEYEYDVGEVVKAVPRERIHYGEKEEFERGRPIYQLIMDKRNELVEELAQQAIKEYHQAD